MYKYVYLLACLFAANGLFGQGLLTGQITDPDGEPLAGAAIFVMETQQGTSTDERGLYRLEGLEPGTYNVRVTYVGFEQTIRTTKIVKGTSQTVLHVQLTEAVFTMEGITVKATRAQEKDPFTFKTLDQKDLRENDLGVDMPYLLQWTPGVVATSDAGTGVGYTGIRIRGTDPTRVNITINGIPLNDAESQGVFWVNLPDFAANVNDVQIQRGVGTSTHGAGAFGATINLNTSELQPEPYGRLSASVGSFNTWKGTVQFGSGLIKDKFSLDGRISRIQSDGFIDRATADLESFYLSGAYVGEKTSLRLVAFSGHEITYQAWYGVPGSMIDNPELRTFNPAGTEKPGEPYDNEVDNYGQDHYQALFNHQINRNLNLNLALHYTRGAGYFEQYVADEERSDYGLDPVIWQGDILITQSDFIRQLWLDNHFYGGTYALDYVNNNSRLKMTLGGAWNQYLGDHFGERIWGELLPPEDEPVARFYQNDATKNDFNTFLKVNYDLTDRLQVFGDIQFRQVDYTFLGFNRNLENVEQTAQLRFVNPKAGLYYELNEQSGVYASFAVGQREPNRDDFVNSTPDSRPRPEQLFNTEAGYKFKQEKSFLQANFYHMYYRDQLVLTGEINDVGAATRINVPESYRLGFELDGGWQPVRWFGLAANLGLSQNRITAFTEFKDAYDADFNWIGQEAVAHENTAIAFSPAVVGALALEWKPTEDLSLTLLNKYVSKQYIDNTQDENAILNPFYFSNLRLLYSLDLGDWVSVELNATVRNLWDNLYETNAWSYRYVFDGAPTVDLGFYPQAGRNYLVGLNILF